ncbi:HAMP domain-containing histidine kinase [Schaalia sp. 19OD2882]|uniref:HAMP domain-containing sensor histidine kinase n=1 Tax=Schaalia sp. 19OD2882 TaxID=2794089 RepID=UPI001C1EA67C|nr:HAMP domain-containing sensor histidine kinase [Schaalia sp. 19OD2882]QWW19198.1 HAMP domain-containing histidine kinase [Schaalia sp. 19OD2882]
MRTSWIARTAAVVAAVAALGIVLVWAVALAPLPRPDAALLNHVAHTAADHWRDLDAADFADVDAEVGVVGGDAQVRLVAGRRADADSTRAARAGASQSAVNPIELLARGAGNRVLTAPVLVDGHLVGMVWVDDGANETLRAQRTRVAGIATGVIAAALATTAATLALVHRRLIAPFHRLRVFARDVAGGNLDTALPMDRSHAFGAWSESFDLMRRELREARQREDRIRDSKEQLVADIGHDIRTPMSTITTTAELVAATTTDHSQDRRLALIAAQAGRIDALVTDLVREHAVEEPRLAVCVEELPTTRIAAILAEVDPEGLVRCPPLPEVLVRLDPARFAQVVGNAATNARKYAGTPVEVGARVLPGEGFLELTLADHGSDPPAEDPQLLLARGARGSNAVGTPGQGLGLHTAATLMERMGGALTASRGEDGGFVVTLLVPLA